MCKGCIDELSEPELSVTLVEGRLRALGADGKGSLSWSMRKYGGSILCFVVCFLSR